jgi:sigma-B regulation protein RsbU (phosphoserine phosphatase)
VRFIPSTQLGGDAFGYRWLDQDHLALYLPDVCGHGVGAALLSVSVLNILRSERKCAADLRDPGVVLEMLNDAFPMERHNGQYFTIWYGVHDRRTRTLE